MRAKVPKTLITILHWRKRIVQCEYKAASEKGLRQHVRMKHNKPEMAAGTPEILRSQRDFSTSLTSSPLLTTREDICKNCGDPFSPGHQCEGNLGTMGCSCSNSNCCGCHHDDSCECRQSNKQTAFCDCRDISDVDCNKQLKPKKWPIGHLWPGQSTFKLLYLCNTL